MRIRAVIGKNFGDEGKGLAVDYFASFAKKEEKPCLVIRHNGGGQAGHTVDLEDTRFVFHQLSSGSFENANTLWAKKYLPDLYILTNECHDFVKMNGYLPKIYAFGDCRCTYIDDVLINMALENSRGKNRHGSCGMGINEAVERSKNEDFVIPLGKIKGITATSLYHELKRIRKFYVPQRLNEVNLKIDNLGEYGQMLQDDIVLKNMAGAMCKSVKSIRLFDELKLNEYEEVIFEGAQGLLLDENYKKFAPHLTTSATGATNPMEFCNEYYKDEEIELVYVTRSYVTRHGAGPLPHEEKFDTQKYHFEDKTNTPNEWQKSIRYAPHGSIEEFVEPVVEDLRKIKGKYKVSLMVTHLNETDGKIYSIDGNIEVDNWCKEAKIFSKVYCSYSPYASEI